MFLEAVGFEQQLLPHGGTCVRVCVCVCVCEREREKERERKSCVFSTSAFLAIFLFAKGFKDEMQLERHLAIVIE